jgi:hypothetical protein
MAGATTGLGAAGRQARLPAPQPSSLGPKRCPSRHAGSKPGLVRGAPVTDRSNSDPVQIQDPEAKLRR